MDAEANGMMLSIFKFLLGYVIGLIISILITCLVCGFKETFKETKDWIKDQCKKCMGKGRRNERATINNFVGSLRSLPIVPVFGTIRATFQATNPVNPNGFNGLLGTLVSTADGQVIGRVTNITRNMTRDGHTITIEITSDNSFEREYGMRTLGNFQNEIWGRTNEGGAISVGSRMRQRVQEGMGIDHRGLLRGGVDESCMNASTMTGVQASQLPEDPNARISIQQLQREVGTIQGWVQSNDFDRLVNTYIMGGHHPVKNELTAEQKEQKEQRQRRQMG